MNWRSVADLLPVVSGLVTVLILGHFVGRVLNVCEPKGVDPKYRDVFSQPSHWALGRMEQLLSFVAFWIQQPLAIGGWLGFKVAAKWASWQHITKMPDNFGPAHADDTERLRTRDALGSYILGRFLIGTLYNVLCGVAGAAAGWLVARFLNGGGPAL